jgi:hypothetical protein
MRLVIEVDGEFYEDDAKLLVINTARYIGLPYDTASKTWSQPMGLPIETSLTSGKFLEFGNKNGNPLDVEKMLNLYPVEEEIKPKTDGFTVDYSKTGKRVNAISYGLLDKLQQVEEGNRENFMKSIISALWRSGTTETEKVFHLAMAINEYYAVPPVDQYHIESLVRSIGEKEFK